MGGYVDPTRAGHGCGASGCGGPSTPVPRPAGTPPTDDFSSVLAAAGGPKRGGPVQQWHPVRQQDDEVVFDTNPHAVEYDGDADIWPGGRPGDRAVAGAAGGAATPVRPAPELVAAPAPKVRPAATSPAGAAFADAADSHLDSWGGHGYGALAVTWAAVGGKGEQAALQLSVARATSARINNLSDIAASWSTAAPSRNDIGRLQVQLRAAHELQRATGLPEQPLRADALQVLRGLLSARIAEVERAAAASAGSPGTPAGSVIADQIGDLQHILPLAQDQALEQRLRAALSTLAMPRST